MKIMLQHDETGRMLGWNEETGPIPYGYSIIQSPPKPPIAAPCVPVAPERDLAVQSGLKAVLAISGALPVAPERDLAVQTARNTPETEQAYRSQRIRLLTVVAEAAEALHKANQLEMGAVEMGKRWLALENALNEWRAAK